MANKYGVLLLLLVAYATAAPVDVRDVTVDNTATRSAWVSSYKAPHESDHMGPTVDNTATRSAWVSSYKAPHESAHKGAYAAKIISGMPHTHSPGAYAWMPSGPGYLDLSNYDLPHTNWLAVPMSSVDHSPSLWGSISRFFAGRM